ncbi:hypothetical protein OS493_035701 [Desmophyllum pertusum]|uniref:Uncharacterized protein n=1 Tax=Desmophyllum pertusum TaxID=174260 RepID=A0A9W9YID6_9CNID|nr:hypothetical protein OS493_035701 [Desmophyllum pertusum]
MNEREGSTLVEYGSELVEGDCTDPSFGFFDDVTGATADELVDSFNTEDEKPAVSMDDDDEREGNEKSAVSIDDYDEAAEAANLLNMAMTSGWGFSDRACGRFQGRCSSVPHD